MINHKAAVTGCTPSSFNSVIRPGDDYQKLLNSSLDVICSIDENGHFITVSAASKKIWGYDPEELTGTRYLDLVIDEDVELTKNAASDIMRGVDMTNFENRYRCKDGSITPIVWSARWDEEEKIMYCVARNATEKRAVEEELQETRIEAEIYGRQLSEILESISDGFFAMNKHWIVTYFNAKAEKLTGIKKEQIIGKNFWSIFPVAKNSTAYKQYETVLRDKKATCFEMFSELFESWYEVNAYPSSGGISIFFKDISERKRTLIALEDSQRKLAEAADQLNSILESIGDGFFAMDNNFIVTYWNKKAEEILGKKREEIIGKNVWDEYKEAVSLQFYAKTIEAMSHQTPVHFEEHLPSVNAWLEVSAYPSKSGLSVYFRNVTDRVQQEKKLSLSNERYELVTKATTDAIWDWDIAANTIYFNEAFTTQFGYAHSVNSLAESWSNNIYAEDTETVLESLSNALADAATKTWECEYRFTRANGDVAYVYDRGFILRNNAGEAIRMVGSMQDTTRQREAEMELRRLSLVAKQTVNAVVITDINEKITWVNQAFTDITEYSFEEAVGKTPKELLQGEETSEATRAYLQQCIQEKKPFSCEIINYSKSGRKYWIEINGQPIFNHKGEVEQLFAIQTDVTERKKNEQAIRLSEQRYKLLFYQSPRPKWIFNIDTLRIVEVNEAALQLYGYSRKEFLQLTITDLKVNEDVKEFNQLLKTLKKDKDFAYQNVVRHLKKSGQLFYIDITTHSIELPSGMHVIVVGNDVTEKFELEKMLIEEKISAQKEIAKAIINTQEKERSEIGKELHDNVNQILTTAKLYVENIQYYPDQTDQFTYKGRDLIQKSINEIRYLSKQLVTPVLNDLGFKATIDELITHYQSLNLFKINFTYTIKDEKIDKGLQLTIYRIVQEQLNNIVKYAKAENVTVIVSQQKTSFKVFISDDGIGFDTSKEPRGLGLSNIKNRAEVYKGKVVIISSPGAGCSLKIIFPL